MGTPTPVAQQLHEKIRSGETLRPELSSELWEQVGDLRLVAGDVKGAITALTCAHDHGPKGDSLTMARRNCKVAHALLGSHRAAAAVEFLERASIALGDSDTTEAAHIEAVRAPCLCEMGRIEVAVEAAARSLELAEQTGDADALAAAHEALAVVSHYRGTWREGLREEIERLDVDADADSRVARVFDHLASRRRARRAEAFGWCLLGESLLLGGRWDEAAACLHQSGEIHAELGNSSGALPWQRLALVAFCVSGLELRDKEKGRPPGHPLPCCRYERRLRRFERVADFAELAADLLTEEQRSSDSRGLNRATGELPPPTSTHVIAATAGKSMWPLCLPRVSVRHASPDRTVAWYCCRKAE